MSLRKRKEEPITLTNLAHKFVATGSQILGGHNENSDYDLLVPPSRMRDAWEILNNQNTTRDEYHNKDIYSYYFYLPDGKKINFIIFRNSALYNAWRYATIRMIEFKIAVPTREERHLVFQAFVQYYLKGENK